MFEKDMNIGCLLDFYGEILSERRRSVMEMYYNEDLSLSEIADEIGISRQGVRDLIKKSAEELLFYEEKLGLSRKLAHIRRHARRVDELVSSETLSAPLLEEIRTLVHIIEE